LREVPAGVAADRPGAEHDNPLVRHLCAPSMIRWRTS
jgi:hypothetical protein